MKKNTRGIAIAVGVLLILAILLALLLPLVFKTVYVDKYGQEYYDIFAGVQTGSYVKFGAYEQDRDNSNGPEAIQWQVLCIEGNKALLVSRYALDCIVYSNTEDDITWEKSYIRSWLNRKFLEKAFNEADLAVIQETQIVPDRKAENGDDPGPATSDRVFLLSYRDASTYFPDNESRRCQATGYAKLQGVMATVEDNVCWWWLRSPGNNLSSAAYVMINGYAYAGGDKANEDFVGVRPAIWVELPMG